jgi:hypothetical protein
MAQSGCGIPHVSYLRQNKSPKSSELLGLLNFEVFYPLQDLRTTLPDPKPSQSYHSGLVCEYLTWGKLHVSVTTLPTPVISVTYSIGLALQPWMFYVTTWTAHALNARQPHLIFSDPVAVWGLLSYGLLRLDNFTNPPKLGVGETYTAEAYILPFHSF